MEGGQQKDGKKEQTVMKQNKSSHVILHTSSDLFNFGVRPTETKEAVRQLSDSLFVEHGVLYYTRKNLHPHKHTDHSNISSQLLTVF